MLEFRKFLFNQNHKNLLFMHVKMGSANYNERSDVRD